MLKAQAATNLLPLPVDEIIKDYQLAYQSRQASVIGRREVFSGRAKFGIFGDGKELANLAIAHAFRKGDWRSGYYRDQTWMFALGVMSIQEFFAQMYAHADVNAEPHMGGRSMNAHFASRYLNPDGSCCRVALEAADRLANVGIEAEVIDVQSLLPFDIHRKIAESLKKTNRILFVDEDVPGATTAYMLREVIEKQGGFVHLDSPPKTLPAEEHRPAYASDGDYWSMPNVESIFDAVYEMMHEVSPTQYPNIY